MVSYVDMDTDGDTLGECIRCYWIPRRRIQWRQMLEEYRRPVYKPRIARGIKLEYYEAIQYTSRGSPATVLDARSLTSVSEYLSHPTKISARHNLVFSLHLPSVSAAFSSTQMHQT